MIRQIFFWQNVMAPLIIVFEAVGQVQQPRSPPMTSLAAGGDVSKVDGVTSASSASFQWSQSSTSALAKTDFASKTAALGSGLTR